LSYIDDARVGLGRRVDAAPGRVQFIVYDPVTKNVSISVRTGADAVVRVAPEGVRARADSRTTLPVLRERNTTDVAATTEGMLKLGYRPFERDVAAVEDTASRMRAHGGARASRADDVS
jgi:hypothetical protein